MAGWPKLLQPGLLALACCCAVPLAAAAAERGALAGRPDCRLSAPAGWSAPQIRWSGDCRAGLADGLGVLREFEPGTVTVRRFFFGRLQAGEIAFGAIERPDGYVAGNFKAGRLAGAADRNTLIEAFTQASAAASQLAAAYQKAGNPASAGYYRYKAEQLASQLD